jgi:HEAT repeat protein
MKNEFWAAAGGYKYLIIFLICICVGCAYGIIASFEKNESLALFFLLILILSLVVIGLIWKVTNDTKEKIKKQEIERIRAEEKAKKEQAEAEEKIRKQQEAAEKAKQDKIEAEKRTRREQSEADARIRREQDGSRTSELWMKKDVDTLIEDLGSPNATNRFHAAFFLGVKKDKKAVNALINALQDNDRNVVANVIIALGEIGDPQALEPLRKLNDTSVEKLQRIAIEKIRRIKPS